jgi:autotransporter-associated beta strand protein
MKTQAPILSSVVSGFIVTIQASHSAEIPKLQNVAALNTGASWVGGVVPGPDDVMLWDSNFTAPGAIATMSQLGGDLTVAGIKVTNVGGTRNAAATTVGFQNTTSANTLTLGASGIDLSTAFQTMTASSRILLSAPQTWTIGNSNTNGSPVGLNNNEDLAFFSQAAATPFNFGGHLVTTTGAGQATATSGYTLSNGTLRVGNNLFVIQGGSNRVTTIADTLNLEVVTGGTLRLQNNSGAGGLSLVSSAPVKLDGGTLIFQLNSALALNSSGLVTVNSGTVNFNHSSNGINTISGGLHFAGDGSITETGANAAANATNFTGNLTGSGNISYRNTSTGLPFGYLRMSGDNSGYSGAITLAGASGNRILQLAAATAGSAAATWDIATDNILQVNGVPVQLGKLQGSGIVTNSSPTTVATLSIGQGSFSGAITNGTAVDALVAVTKVGAGTLLLTGANTYSGLTTVSEGTLVLTPDHIGAGDVTVADGATFGVFQKAPDTTLALGDLTVGSTTGGTLLLDFGSQTNPGFASLAVDNLLFNGPSTVKVVGKNLTVGSFPLFEYTTLDPAGTAINALTLDLPTRTTGSIVNDPGIGINLTIATTEQVKWNGDASDAWDIDPDGSGGAGTPNWLTTVGNAATRYIQGPDGTDYVTFDDSATGSGTVNLTTTLSPFGLTINNDTKAYTFTGSGKLSGFASLEKVGPGTLTIANTSANDYSGGTLIQAGTLRLGDGVTPGAGVISGSIANEGTLVLNRPDDHEFAMVITGDGTLEKAQANTVTVPVAANFSNPLALTGGTARFAAGGVLSGIVSGTGTIEATGGTLELGGFDPNTHSGPINVSAGQLRLNKPADTQAAGGDITLTGAATLSIVSNEQIADTATINVFSSSADSLPGTPGTETFANANVNGPTAATQMILRSNANVTGTATVTQGILGVASGHNASVGTIVINSPTGLVRIAGSGGPSTLTVGAGGITASAGEIQVKFNTNEQNAVLKLNGDVTTTGNLAFTNANYAGGLLNVIELNGSRAFNIGDGTTTTVAPDLGDYDNTPEPAVPGALVKNGAGTLVLTAACNAAHSGGTTVNTGTLQLNGPHVSAIQVNPAGTLAGSGTLAAAATVGGTLAPGVAVGQLNSTSTVTLAPDSGLNIDIGNWAGATPGTDWDHLAVDTLALAATPANKLTLRILGTPAGFSESAKTLVIATSTQPITGFDVNAIAIDASGFSGTGTWIIQQPGNTLELVYTAGAGTPFSTWADDQGLTAGNNGEDDDPDEDGDSNRVEFAVDGNATSGKASGKVVHKIATANGEPALTLTLPVRNGAVFSGATEQSAIVDGVVYRIQAGNSLAAWGLAVSEVTGADATTIQAGLPPLSTGWTYRTFRSPGPVSGDPKEFIRVLIEELAVP